MIYRGPVFLAVIYGSFGSSPTLFPPLFSQQVVFFLSFHVCRRMNLLTGEVGKGGRGDKLYYGEKASINHLILSG
jgi:hypothetical protein